MILKARRVGEDDQGSEYRPREEEVQTGEGERGSMGALLLHQAPFSMFCRDYRVTRLISKKTQRRDMIIIPILQKRNLEVPKIESVNQ